MRNKRIFAFFSIFLVLFVIMPVGLQAVTPDQQITQRSSSATINVPVDGSTVSGVTSISVYASTSYSMRAYLYIDGSQADYWTTKGTRSWDWDTTMESDGSHEIRLEVYEYYWFWQLSSAQDIANVIVDNGSPPPDTTPPTISITSPSEGATLTSSDVTVTWTGSDTESGIDYYETRIDSGSWINKGTGTSHTFTGLTDGSHTVEVRAWDNAGNGNTDSVTFTIDTSPPPDTTPPTITITNPSEGATLTSADVTIQWTGSDTESGIDYYQIRIDSGSWVNKGTATSHSYTGLADGSHTVDVQAWDVAGNSNTDSVTFTIDTSTSGDPVVHTFTGSLSQGQDSTQHQFDVPTNTASVEVELTFAGSDYDLSLWDDQNRRTGGWTSADHSLKTNIPNSEYSGYSANPEWINVIPPSTAGTWSVGCFAYSGSGGYTITVTVTPSGPDTTPPMITITSPANGATVSTSDVTVIWSGSDDGSGIDYYEIRIDSGSWINKGTATSHTFNGLADGSYTVDVRAWDAAGNSNMDTVSFTVDTSSAGTVTKYAVIVGISDYKAISDLSYCDEDATDWFNHLTGTQMDYDYLWVYGDGHSSNYPQWNGYATEYNVKQALLNVVSQADSNDIIAFTTSGHGSGNGYGSSYLCMWDCGSGESGEDGDFYDTELTAILDDAIAEKIFVFIDHCYSGGFGPDLMNMPNSNSVYVATTCTDNGYGYDDPTHNNGAWTYYFLEYSWINHFGGSASVSMEEVFSYAHNAYPHSGGDEPEEYDGNTSEAFYLV